MRIILVLALLCLARLGDGRRVSKNTHSSIEGMVACQNCYAVDVNDPAKGCEYHRPMSGSNDGEALCPRCTVESGICFATEEANKEANEDRQNDETPKDELGELGDEDKVDCAGEYGEPTQCSKTCGGGSRWREFVETTPPANGGRACPQKTKFETCNTTPCPVDCVGNYGNWGGCSKNCDRGQQTRTFVVTTQAAHGGKACTQPQTQSQDCNTHKCKKNNCFPADALVETPLGPKAMSDVKVGDLVRSVDGAGRAFFDTVYFFGHADASSSSTYVDVELQGDRKSLQLSQKHFLPICPNQSPCEWTQHINIYAQDLKLGDYVWVVGGDRLDMRLVQGLSLVSRKGLYNPYTLNGKVVVNNVVASAHSNWVLDSWVPADWAQYLPAVYQTLFLPGRWLYHVFGSDAADILDMNNPQVAPEKHGQGPEFLGSCAVCAALAMWLLSPKGFY